jgi:hypothetical protein
LQLCIFSVMPRPRVTQLDSITITTAASILSLFSGVDYELRVHAIGLLVMVNLIGNYTTNCYR